MSWYAPGYFVVLGASMMVTSSSQAEPAAASHADRPAPVRPGQTPETPRGSPRWDRVSLLWRVFAANIVVFVVAAALLAWTPVTVHRVATPSELVILAIGVALMLAVDLVLLRRAFGPLRRLADVMGAVDPGRPGRRAEAPRGAGREVVALASALNAMLDRLEGERLESGRRALAAQEGERTRIARELHDEIGQTLTAIALRAERAAGDGPEVSDGAEASDGSLQRQALIEIAETVLRSLEDVRRIGRELRPEALDDLGLVNALIVLCSRVDGQAGLRVRRNLDWDLPPLSPEVELVIYRVAQEALTNALRHANGTEVTVTLAQVNDRVVLIVADDGRGLPVRTNGGRARRNEGAGDADRRRPGGRSGAGLGTEIVLSVPAGSA